MTPNQYSPEEIAKSLHWAATAADGSKTLDKIGDGIPIGLIADNPCQKQHDEVSVKVFRYYKGARERNAGQIRLVADLSLQGRVLEVLGGEITRTAIGTSSDIYSGCRRRATAKPAGCSSIPESSKTIPCTHDEEEGHKDEGSGPIPRRRPLARYRTGAGCLRRRSLGVNHKRVQSDSSEQGARVLQKAGKSARLGTCEKLSQRIQAGRANEDLCNDFAQERSRDGLHLKILRMVDECTCDCLVIHIAREIHAEGAIGAIQGLLRGRWTPGNRRRNNEPEFIARGLRGWLAWQGEQTQYMTPGSPWANTYSESVNSRLRDRFLSREEFATEMEAKVQSAEWRPDYNEARPHSALGDQTAAEFAARCRVPVAATPLPPRDGLSLKSKRNLSKQVVHKARACHTQSDT